MRDEGNRLSSVDYLTPGGRFVIASDEQGRIHPDAQPLLSLIPIPYVSSAEASWDRGLLSPNRVRLAPRTGFALSFDDDRAVLRGGYGIFLNQWAYSVQTAFARNLPFFYTKQVDVPASQRSQLSNRGTSSPAIPPPSSHPRSWTMRMPWSTRRRGAVVFNTSSCRRR